jgi:hypothetical protein
VVNPALRLAVLTLGLGATVAATWFIVGGSAAYRGPLPVVRDLWLPLYGFEALLAAAGTYWFASRAGPIGVPRLIALVVAAWVGEWLVLLLGTALLLGNVGPEFASFYWLVGTGGPVQPVAAAIGGVLALRRDARTAT